MNLAAKKVKNHNVMFFRTDPEALLHTIQHKTVTSTGCLWAVYFLVRGGDGGGGGCQADLDRSRYDLDRSLAPPPLRKKNRAPPTLTKVEIEK